MAKRKMSDTAKFRAALTKALGKQGSYHMPDKSFSAPSRPVLRLIFNDKRKTFRRLKLYFAAPVADASARKQTTLRNELKKQFGKRFIDTKVLRPSWAWAPTSYAVYLKK